MGILDGFFDGLRPIRICTVSQWADEHRYLSSIAAAEPGRWNTERTPYLRKIMDSLSNYSTYKKIIVMKGAQLGLTEAGNNWLGYIIDNSPAPTLMVQPTEDMVKRNSKMRIDTMIDSSPNLRLKVSKMKSKSGENTINQKNFPNGILLMAGANAPSGLRSVPVKNIFLDEVDAYPSDLGGEGSPIDLATARTRTFRNNKKIFIISTPTIKGASVIEAEFLKTDQNYFHVPCPHCGCFHTLEFENLRWDKKNYNEAKMMCPECGELISERNKPKMLKAGIWKPKCEEKIDMDTIGFHISSLYSPYGWHSWGDMAKDYDEASDDPAKMKTFINTELGETTEESGERPEWRNVYNKRELYSTNTIHDDICFLTCGVDIQKDRIELEIVGWLADKQSYSIDFRVLLGNTTLPDVWGQLEEILDETWERSDGISLGIVRMCVDSGYNTSEVYDFCRNHSPRAIAIKGQNNLGIAFAPPRQVDYNRKGQKIGKAKQWNIGVSFLKAEFYAWITLEPKEGIYPPRYCHFPQYDERYFEGLISEEFVQSKNKWVKKYERNEPLDTRIYARAAAAIVGLDSKSKEKLIELGGFVVHEHKEEDDKEDQIIEKKSRNKEKIRSFWNK